MANKNSSSLLLLLLVLMANLLVLIVPPVHSANLLKKKQGKCAVYTLQARAGGCRTSSETGKIKKNKNNE
jgi:hypothetical protein